MSTVAERPRRKGQPEPPGSDPTTRYALDVCSGKIVAGRAVRQACQRHLTDLTRQRTEAFPYYFDVASAQNIIDFFPEFLTLENGEPFILPPWLQFCYGCIFGWKRVSDDKRKYPYAYLETSKGSGKALALDTPIPTPSGWSTMGTLRVGDRVFDERGRIVNVTGVSDVMSGHECFEVVFDDGASIVADADHLWFTEQRNSSRADGKIATAGVKLSERGRWKRAIRTTREIARTVRYSNGKYQSANHSIPLAGPLGTPSEPLPIEPYALGVWLGDGDSDCGRITVHDADAEIVEHVMACGVVVGERQQSIRSPRAPRYRFDNGTATLRRMGLIQNKHIPAVYLRASVEQRLSLLQGLMDTDGYIGPGNGECVFTSTKRGLADGVRELIISLGIKCTLRDKPAKLYGREVSRCYHIQFHPPHDLPVFRLRRKLQWQVQRHIRRRLSGDRRIEHVRPVPSVPVKCITVDSESHLFLAGHAMIPTHNSPGSAGVGIYGQTFDDEPYAEIYSAAFDRGQASIILNDAIRMVNDSADLTTDCGLEATKYNIANLQNGSFFRAVSAETRGKSGPRPHMVLADEPHEWRDGSVVNKLVAGFKFRTQPLVVYTTNSGSDKTSVCWELHQKSLSVVEGTQPDEQWFAYVCHLEPCDECYTNGYRQPRDGCEACDNWQDPAVWPKVAPALGIVIQPKYLQDAIDRAMSIPSEYSLIRRLNFCIWTESHQVWIPPDKWDACKVPAVHDSNPDLWPCTIGLDPASTLDLASAAVALRIDDPPSAATDEETVEIEGMDEFGERIRFAYLMNFSIEVIPFFWMPKDTLIERVRTERIPYDVWARAGKLFPTPGASIDHHAIYDFILKDLWKRFKVQKLGMDQNGGRYLYMKFQSEGRLKEGEQLVNVGQGFKLSEAFKFMEILIAKRRLLHDGHPVLAWNMANAEPVRNSRTGALMIDKPNKGTSQTKRIDGAVAAAMAIRELMALPVRKKKSAGVFFV